MLNSRYVSSLLFKPAQLKPAQRTSKPMAADGVRAMAMRLVKAPLLGRFAVDWQWPRTADLSAWEPFSIPSRSGASLAVLYGTGDGVRKGVVVCAHPLRRDAKGFFLTSGRADVLRRAGFDVLLFDFNGFGASSQGDFNYVGDVLAARRGAQRPDGAEADRQRVDG